MTGYEHVDGVYDQDWSDMKSLRNFLEQNAPYKSKEKYLGILNILLGHSALLSTSNDIKKCINAAIAKILAPGNRKPGRRSLTPTPIKSRRLQLAQPPPTPQPAFPPSPETTTGRKRGRMLPMKLAEALMSSSPQKKKVKRKVNSYTRPPPVAVQPIFRPKPIAAPLKLEPPSPYSAAIKEEQSEVDEEGDGHGDADGDMDGDGEAESRRGRAFSFDGEAVFIDHEDVEDLDPNAQPWELLDPMPTRDSSPANFRRRGGPSNGAGSHSQASHMPYSMGMLTTEACKLLVPFPECVDPANKLHLSPFPLETLETNPFYQRPRSGAMF